jgi:signal peptidase I
MLTKRISNPILRNLLEWVIAGVLALLLFFVMRTFVFRIATVSGPSMLPSLRDGDMVFLNRFSYLFIEPQVGDIVAFPNPNDPSEHYIKRVIGAPGDVIDLRMGIFYVNDFPLDDSFSHEVVFITGDVFFPVIVEDGHFFVLGDNRNQSMDSRNSAVSNVPGDVMVGRVAFRIWPMNALGRVD